MEGIISERAAKILDLLEQIDSVNQMIVMHEGDSFMREQYIYRKNEFVKSLGVQLSEYKIEPEDLAA